MDTHALYLSLILTAVGMSVIFIFMGALIAIVHFYLKAAERFFPDRRESPETGTSGGSVTENPEEVAAAIAAAIGRVHE